MTDQWKEAYKTIYGKSPGKADYTLAPSNIPNEALDSNENMKNEEKGRNLFGRVKLKRPAQYSPVKQIIKKRAVQSFEDNEDKPVTVAVRVSPRKKMQSTSFATSPVKKVLFAPIPSESCFKSPAKMMKGDEGTPRKMPTHSGNPSPRKPLSRNKVTISCADTLYETKSPMKNTGEIKEKTLDEIAAEEAESMSRPKMGRKKNRDTNFLKLNMKKGYHAKGKLTAEQKRKFKKKANFKKFKTGQ